MAWDGSRNTPAWDGGRTPPVSPYTEDDALVVEKAKRVHKETTASAQRALKVNF